MEMRIVTLQVRTLRQLLEMMPHPSYHLSLPLGLQIDSDAANEGNDPNETTYRTGTVGR